MERVRVTADRICDFCDFRVDVATLWPTSRRWKLIGVPIADKKHDKAAIDSFGSATSMEDDLDKRIKTFFNYKHVIQWMIT
jgi:hypothetical protein